MKNLKQIKAKFKKKAFTLVELLVAIAIVAVISTVSVVGYTSFIKKADISNDETLVRQLNSFLDAYRVSNGNLEVTPENAREVILSVMEKGKVAELVPNSAKYGYGIYLDLESDGGKPEFKLLKEDEAEVASSANPAIPEMIFTAENLFFAEISKEETEDEFRNFINSFYSIDSQSEFDKLLRNAQDGDINKGNDFYSIVNSGVFVSKNGNFATDGAKNRVFFNDGITSINSSEHLDSLTVSEPIQIPSSVKFITSGALVFADQYKYVGTDSETVFKFNVLSAEKLGGMVDPKFTNAVFELTDGNRYAWDEAKNKIVCLSDPSVEISVDYKNKLQSFTLYASSETQGKVAGAVNQGIIAWDVPEFELKLGNLVGTDPSYEFISAYNIEWEFDEKYVTLVDGRGVFKFTNELPESSEIEIKAKDTINNATQTYTVKVYRITGATIKLAGKPWNDRATLIYGDQSNSENKYTVSVTELAYSFDASELELDETVSLVTSGDAFGVAGDTLIANAAGGTQSVSVKIGTKYVSSASEISIYNVSNLPFSIKYGNLAMVGNGNEVTAGDLFRENTTFPATLPDDAKLVVYSAVYGDDNYINLDNRVPMPNAGDGYAFYVKESEIALNGTNWKNAPIKFNGTSTAGAPVAVAIQFGDVRVSPDVSLAVVDGNNVRDYTELKANVTSSVVLLDNITMESDGSIIFSNAGTIYGNCFTFDIKSGVNKGTFGIITLSNTNMRDLRVVGQLYETVGISATDPWGSNAVHAKGTVTIENCYIANCRAPLAAGHEDSAASTQNITVKNSVLFGGRYANIDLRGGNLKFEGKVIAINQPHTDNANADSVKVADRIVGFGIAVWLEAPEGTSIQNIENLVQYNFIPKDYNDIPNVSISASGITVTAKLNDLFQEIFSNTSKYGDYQFERNGKKYINPGILGEDVGDGASNLASVIKVTLPSGDRTGFNETAPSNYKYVCMEVDTDFTFLFWTLSVDIHTYGILNTQENLFAASENAEFRFSPWDQTAGGVRYPEYTFTNGSILPN